MHPVVKAILTIFSMPLILLFFFYIYFTIAKIFPYAIVDPYIQTSIIIFLSLLSFLIYKKWLTPWGLSSFIFVYSIIAFPICRLLIENSIKNFAIKNYGEKPKCVQIDFNVNSEFRHPHALIEKDGKFYYWSFKKHDFIENNNIRYCF